MSDVTSIITISFSVVSALFVVWRIKETAFKYHASTFELYEKLKELCGRDANENYPALLVGLNTLSKKQLSPAQIEWFIHCPNAFLFLKRFDAGRRYINLDMTNNCFEWQMKLNMYSLQVIVYLLYVLMGTLGTLGVVNFVHISERIGLELAMILAACSIVLILFAVLLLRESNIISDAWSLVKKGDISDLKDC